MEKIEVGQIIYVSMEAMFTKDNHGLSEYRVTNVNSKSIHAEKIGSDYPLKLRFDKKTMVHNGGIGFLYRAYINEEDYWKEINEKREVEELRCEISKSLPSLKIEELREIVKIIKE